MRKIKYTIIEDKYEDGLPTFFVLKSVFYFGFNTIGQLYGEDNSSDIPFQTLEQAETYLKLLKNE